MHKLFHILRLLLLVIIPVLLSLLVYSFMTRALFEPVNPADAKEVSVEISQGMTFKDVCRLLKDKGIVRYARGLDLMARLKGSPTDKIKAGEYMLSPAMSPAKVLAKLVSGEVLNRTVMLAPGISIHELSRIVADSGLLSKEEMENELVSGTLLARAGIASNSFEGYLYPDTYFFSRPITAKDVIWKMLEEGETHWPKDFSDQADKLGMSRHEILTLASIIEKETGRVSEQPVISSVFHNRLKMGIKLQSDPTVIYGIQNFNGNITKEDLQTPTPYNTYTNLGLPPGPICNPGESAVKAALFPAETQFLYFVADGTGGHVFSTTLAEHNENVAKLVKGTVAN